MTDPATLVLIDWLRAGGNLALAAVMAFAVNVLWRALNAERAMRSEDTKQRLVEMGQITTAAIKMAEAVEKLTLTMRQG